MSKIKGTQTISEVMLRKELWNLGIRYRINVSKLPGKPDIVIGKARVAIFVDGEFWHGYNWQEKKNKIKANRDYWIKKIEGNIYRDAKNNEELLKMGYKVLRFWEHEIKQNLAYCVNTIFRTLNPPE